MRLLAPAKINLHLRVGPRRASDGFHPLLSWMCTVGLFDILELHRTDEPGVFLTTDRSDLTGDQSNLVVKAASAAAELAERGSTPNARRELDRLDRIDSKFSSETLGGLRALLQKRIPIGAGLGGGSSDAARTLMGLNRLWRIDWPSERLIETAAKLGSDVPFFLLGPSSVCSGRGEVVKPISPPKPKVALLILTNITMPTADVYRRFDEMSLGSNDAIANEPDWQNWTQLSAEHLLPKLVNDLEPAAFSLRPDLSRLRDDAEQKIGRVVRMSGSGGSLFTLFDETTDAISAAERISAALAVQVMTADIAPAVKDDLT